MSQSAGTIPDRDVVGASGRSDVGEVGRVDLHIPRGKHPGKRPEI